MGAVGPAVVTASFFNFAPDMVRRSVPDAWKFASPPEVLEARLAGVDRALRALLGPQSRTGDLGSAADLLRRAAETVSFRSAGRPLGAANAALAWPSDPLLALWQPRRSALIAGLDVARLTYHSWLLERSRVDPRPNRRAADE